jgi:hypothetical protein
VRSRLAASIGLTVIGAVLLLIGGLALYAREEIVDQDAFAERATETLEQEAVAHAVSRELAADVSNAGPPALISARPILESVFEALIATQQFERVFEQAARQANRILFTHERTVAVTLEDAVKVLRSALSSANPKLAEKVPKNLEPELARLEERGFATAAIRFADDVRLLGILLPLLALVTFAGGAWIAPDRRSSITRTGLAIGAIGLLTVVALTVLEHLVVTGLEGAVLETDEVQAAGDAIWDGFFGDLRTWAIAVGAAGLILAAASASLLAPVEVADRVARVRARLTTTPRTTPGRVGRGIGAIALGVFVVASPTLAVQILAVTAGALLLFFGTSELLSVIQAPDRRSRAAASSRRRLVVAAGVAAAAAVVVVLVVAIGDDEEAGGPIAAEEIAECNGAAELCDRRLNEVTFPGTHNSMSAADDRGWLIANQRHDISTQLEDGIRVLLIDPHYGVEDGTRVRTDLIKEGTDRNRIAKAIGEEGLAAAEDLVGKLGRGTLDGERVPYLCHSVCELGATKMAAALGDIRSFLEDNRFEVVIIFIEPSIEPEEIDAEFKQVGLLPYVATLARYEPLPTLRDMIASNRRLVVFTERDGGDPPWYHEGFSFTQDTEVGAELDECVGRNGNESSPLMMVNHWVDGFPPPVEANEKVTTLDALLERARTCKQELGRVPNLFPVDQYDRGDIVEAAEQLNGLADGEQEAGE